MSLNLFLGEVQVPTAGWAFTIDGGGGGGPIAKTIPTGSYYLRSTVAAASLIATFEAKLDEVSSTTVAFDNATGRVTVTNNHAANTITIAWTAGAFRDALGFTGASTAIGPLASSTGAAQAKFVWLPNTEPSELSGYLGSKGRRLDDAKQALSNSGAYKRTAGTVRWEQELAIKALTAARTWTAAEALANESLEQFWIDCLNAGLRVRWFLDRTSTSYVQSIEFRCATERLEPVPTISGSHAWWDARLKLVPADET